MAKGPFGPKWELPVQSPAVSKCMGPIGPGVTGTFNYHGSFGFCDHISEPSATSTPKLPGAKNDSVAVPAHPSQPPVGVAAEAKATDEQTVPSVSAAEAPTAKAAKSKAVLPTKKRDVGAKQPEAVIDDEPVIKLSLEHGLFDHSDSRSTVNAA